VAAPALNPMLPLIEFIRQTTAVEDPILAACRAEAMAPQARTAQGGAPPITPEAGKFLHVLARAVGAKRILEVGTGVGYSGVWLARALPRDGQLVTVELDPARARAAQGWFQRAGVAHKVQLQVGKALGVLPAMPTKSFDLAFIDANKDDYPRYFELALRLVRSGGVVCADNVFWFGAALSDEDGSPEASGVRAYNRLAASTPGVATILLPLGDGLSVSVRSD
jgi:predicted O-methyltransferase YrrM